MNAVEIEEAVSALAEAPFDPAEFPFQFLQAFGNKDTTIRRLRKGESNRSDVPGAVLQTNHIHLLVTASGAVGAGLAALTASPATVRAKARFVLATDGDTLEAAELASGETVACAFRDLPNRFGFLLPLAGISTVRQVKESAFDIRATGRLNKLYVTLLAENPDWGTAARRPEMNHFLARLIFCFFAEDTGIFHGAGRFTATVEQFSARDSSNTHEVIEALFRAMNTPIRDRAGSGLRPWADAFPYVNGGLFSGSPAVPRFSRMARSYLIHIGGLDWTRINPDIFGSMIQAVADDEERGALGMHYTSVPNILKVLDPLFLDELRERLAEAGENGRKLLNLRARMARIRVFDPACGSGNFLVIAYKAMREIEAEINRRRGEAGRASVIPLTNFRGIEIRHFPAEIARLALIIAEYQCDVLYLGQKEALAEFLPLDQENWIVCGNALRLDWASVCPPAGAGVRVRAEDLFAMPEERQAEIGFENEGGETYICGNPPFQGSREQTADQKNELRTLLNGRIADWKQLDYVSGWFVKGIDYGSISELTFAFVTTNSICQGQHVPILWPLILSSGLKIKFAHTSFKWTNLASRNAGVTVSIVCLTRKLPSEPVIFSESDAYDVSSKKVENISPYLLDGPNLIVEKSLKTLSNLSPMNYGNYPGDGNHLTMSSEQRAIIITSFPDVDKLIRPIFGAQEFIKGMTRYCLWIDDHDLSIATTVPEIKGRISKVREVRLASRDAALNKLAARPHQYRDRNTARENLILIPTVSSAGREFLPADLKDPACLTTNQAFALYDAPLWNMALIASRLHLTWIATVCGKLKTDYRYSNTLGWNTFPVPPLTEQHKEDLTRCAEGILLAREAHFPATVAELYDPDAMPPDLRQAHERNDETLERIYVGRRFRNDTERLETLFRMYGEMVAKEAAAVVGKAGRKGGRG